VFLIYIQGTSATSWYHLLTDAFTSAVLTYEIALQQLNHFCNTLPKTDHVENCPIFIVHEHPLTGFRRAEVILPNSIDPSVRRTLGRQYWKTERQAKKDASFETYLALYRADLVNDHLLPAPRLTQGPSFKIEDGAAMASISPCINPWVLIATDWREAAKGELHAVVITIRRPTQANLQMLLILPKKPPAIAECKLFWNSDTEYHATFTSKRFCDFGFDQEPLELYRTANDLILESIHHQKRPLKQGDKVLLFSPLVDQLAPWLMANSGAIAASEVKASDQLAPASNIVRSPSLFNMPLLFDSWTEENTLKATTFPRRRNFLAPNNSNSQLVALTKSHVLAVQNTTFDLLSSDAITFSLLIPSLEHHIGKILLSNKLCSELLAEVGFADVSLVVEALCATSANSSMNYERLELIGDSTLKFIVAIQLFATKPKWHEGYLSAAKDCIVANSRLARAALDEGLDKYIITEPFSPRKWRACCVNDMIQHDPTPIRKVSSKVLADVVEALIGAALIDRGLSGATKCAHRFMPEVHLQMPREYLEPLLCCLESPNGGCPPHLAQVEALLNYKFQNPSLLTESLTHPSLASDFSTPSYQRLEFLGDAVLDMLIIRKLASYRDPTISHVQMHLIKSALVNATFLAFLCMEMSGKKEITDIVRVRSASVSLEATVRSIRKQKRVALHEFLRFSPSATSLIRERQACLLRYDSLAPRIRAAMEISTEHPWALLSQLNAPKFLSDIVEALIGAVFVDSHGDLGACEQLAGRFGITQYLGRIIEDKVGVLHPKSRLGELVGRKDGKKERGKNKVKYTIRKEEEEEGKVGYRCHVSIGDAVFDEIREGLTRDEVTTRAANVAVHVLLAKKETFNVCEDC
jgi:dsRNA-specific ribonuclease